MVSAGDGRVKAALVVLVLAGCFWRTYGRLAATHVEVLTAMARKGADLVASGRLTAESMPELTYPLERAQAFARTARERSGEAPPASLAAFAELLERLSDAKINVTAIDAVSMDGRYGAIFWVAPKDVKKTATLLGAA